MSNVNEGVEIPGESKGSSLNPEQQQELVEQKARALGWKPPAEFKGDPEDAISAKEYLGRQKLYDRIKDLKGDLYKQSKKFEKDLAVISDYMLKQEEAAYKRAKEELKEQRRAARVAEDHEAVDKIEEKIDELENEQRQLAAQQAAARQRQQAQGPTPEFVAWKNENKWFGSDQEMTQDAVSFGTGYAAAHPESTQEQVLEETTKRIRKLYPEKFQSPAQKAAADVESGEGGSRPAPSASRKTRVTVNDLNDDERKVMRAIVQRGVLKKKAEKNGISQEEQFLRDYSSQR